MTYETHEPIEYLSAELRTAWEDNEFYPSDVRRFEEAMVRWDIETWLETGATDHFAPNLAGYKRGEIDAAV